MSLLTVNKAIKLNPAQLVAILAPQKIKMLIWGRGTGKSTILAWFMIMMVRYMPKATFILVGNTYSQILSVTLKSTKEGLAMLGYYEGIDYVVGTKAGKKMGYKLPNQTPDKWDNVIHWSNGTIFQLVSLDNENSGRGINSSGFLSDETALQDEDKLAIAVHNTNRSIPKEIIYKNNPYLFSETYVTSMPVRKKGKWVLKYKEFAQKEPSKYLFLLANARSNLENLRPDYFEHMKKQYSSDLLYNAEMENIEPREVVDGFYPQWNPDIHCYTDFDNSYLESIPLTSLDGKFFDCRQDRDLDSKLPLIISIDYGANINTLTVSQDQGDVYRVTNCFYVKSPKILDHLILEEFIPYYKYYPNKVIKFYGDVNGNRRTANSKLTYSQQVVKMLRKEGWRVHEMTVGTNPRHMAKFRLINVMLKEDGSGILPKIRVNETNCKDLIVSIENAESKEGSNGIEKNKNSERSKLIEQQHATHFSDTFDYPIFEKYYERFLRMTEADDSSPKTNIQH